MTCWAAAAGSSSQELRPPRDPGPSSATTSWNTRRWSDAELALRESLVIRAKAQPDDWARFNTMSQLGEAVLGLGRCAEAEPLIVEGYKEMRLRQARIPAASRPRLAEAAGRVVRLYASWGQSAKAEEWRRKVGEDLLDRGFPADPFAY